MLVRAKDPIAGQEIYGVGYYNHRLFKGGEEFELSDPNHFSTKWMEKVEKPQPEVQFVEIDSSSEEKTGKKNKR